MKMQKLCITKKVKCPKLGNLETIKACKLGGKRSINTHLTQKKTESKNRIPFNFAPTAYATASYSEDICITPVKLVISLNSPKLSKPDDFIEPFTNLSIPSTEEFFRHKNLSEPIPEIVDDKKSIGFSYQCEKRIRATKCKAVTRSLQLNKECLQNSLSYYSINESINKTKISKKTPLKTLSKKLKASCKKRSF
ncbi:hypothetical protein SteCoe_2185 [Stentor coeruleus]|uniref:Uncharacterized protein n=1 Tax=Stentor coeruleus TaxID=5963 RepID=A0A1R2CZV4_9CILI|nr:hypothetical protein SteCoe_2185 [Stentor coeruleus]